MRIFTTPRRTQVGGAAFLLAVIATAVSVVVVAGAGPRSSIGRSAVVVLVVIQAGSLGWMRRRPERSTAVSLAAGVGLEALWPQLGFLGLANFSLCALAALRPPTVSLWALGFALARRRGRPSPAAR